MGEFVRQTELWKSELNFAVQRLVPVSWIQLAVRSKNRTQLARNRLVSPGESRIDFSNQLNVHGLGRLSNRTLLITNEGKSLIFSFQHFEILKLPGGSAQAVQPANRGKILISLQLLK